VQKLQEVVLAPFFSADEKRAEAGLMNEEDE
jgi:hypothetical protein